MPYHCRHGCTAAAAEVLRVGRLDTLEAQSGGGHLLARCAGQLNDAALLVRIVLGM